MAKLPTENQWLTEAVVKGITPSESTIIIYDQPDPRGKQGWTSGFGIRVTPAGARSFVLRYRVRSTGRERRMTIGSWPTWSVVAARDEARELKRRIDQGGDPLGEHQAERGAETVAGLCDSFLEGHVAGLRPSTRSDYKSMVETHIKPALGKMKVAAVTRKDIERLHRDVSKRGPYIGNRALAVASKMFSEAVRDGLRADNPCRGVRRNKEHKRTNYLRPDQLPRLVRALAEHPDQRAANVLRLALLTGARKGEVLSAEWPHVDFHRNVWVRPAALVKQNREHTVPLSAAALSLLRDMRKAASADARYLFPSRTGGGHMDDVKRQWAIVCKRAGITGMRIHDLRHSYASFLVSAGYSLPTIGEMLGHSDPATTSRYAHLMDDPLREAANKVGSLMVGLVAKKPAKRKLKVVAGGAR